MITAFAVLVFWILLIVLWSMVNFTFSFDWIFAVVQKLVTGQKINWKDPMRSRDIIHKAEIVFEREIENSEQY